MGQVALKAEDDLIGRTLPGGFVVIELVGVGGMGRVYRAEQTNLGRTVAVKIVHPHLVGEENAVARFITEARASSRLNHPNSVSIIDFGKTNDGLLYLVMEFLRGRDLGRVMFDDGPLNDKRIVLILKQILAALSEAHSLEIIHRDLKPENVILSATRSGGDFVKVVDFGLAKMKESGRPSITNPGIVCGTPEYMSPEQGRGDNLDRRSDLYAVGVIFFQLLTGQLPFEAGSATETVLLHLSEPVPDPRLVAPSRKMHQAFVEVLMKSLAKERDDRFSTAEEFSDALGNALLQAESATQSRPSQITLVCEKCGAQNAGNQKFCGECGASLGSGPSVIPPRSELLAPRAPKLSPSATAAIGSVLPTGGTVAPPFYALPFSGRDDEVAWLEERRMASKTGVNVARLVGEVGSGKTRLLRDFVELCGANGDLVTRGEPHPSSADVGLYAVRRIIETLARIDESAVIAAIAGDLLPLRVSCGLADAFGVENRVDRHPQDRRGDVLSSLTWAIVEAQKRINDNDVVMIAIDDFQAIDGASRNVIADLIAHPPKTRVLIVLAHTPEFVPTWKDLGEVRILSGLPTSIANRLVSELGATSLPPDPKGYLPLYLDQFVRFTREQGPNCPTRVADVLSARIERLKSDSRKLLQALCVVGDEASKERLSLLVELDALDASVTDLERGGFVAESKDKLSIMVAHPLIREVVHNSMPAAVRKELHRRAAEAGEMRADPTEVRARHETFAERSFEALFLLERVGGMCAARGDAEGNILALRRGLELARRELFRGELEDPMRAVAIFGRKLGEALAQHGSLLEAEGVLRESLDMVGPSGPDRARVLGALARVANGRKHHNEAQMYLREAIEIAQRLNANELLDSFAGLQRVLQST